MNLRFSGVNALALAVLVSLLISGCSQTVFPDQPTPIASPTPSQSTPAAISAREELALVTSAYEAGERADSGLNAIKPLLEEFNPEEFDLSQPDSLQRFDSKVLPRLAQAFKKTHFATPHPLRSEPPAVDYRALRGLVQLTLERASLHWDAGEQGKALELFELPFSLSSSMNRRPQSVSSNLFASTYSDSALRTLEDWLGKGLTAEQVGEFQAILGRHRPDYEHLRQTFTVDMAQLLNSLQNDPETLGLSGMAPEKLKEWESHLLEIYEQGSDLYDLPTAPSPANFNQAVLSAPPELQGLIIEYPEISSSQKHLFFRYLAAELSLSLEASVLKTGNLPTDITALTEATFGPFSQEVLEVLIVRPEEASTAYEIAARGDTFALLPGGQDMVLFDRRSRNDSP